MKPFSQDLIDQVVAMRQSGLTREEVAAALGIKVSQVKNIQTKAGLVIPMEQRQKNALREKLKKNPNALSEMRKTAYSAVANEKRSKAITSLMQTDRGLVIKADSSARMSAMWESKPDSERTKYRGADVSVVAQELGMSSSLKDTDPLPQVVAIRCHCGRDFSARAFDFLYRKIRSCGCVKSHAEGEIADYLRRLSGPAMQRDRRVIPPYELDVWMPDRLLAIEYCGLHYHSDLFKPETARTRHLQKLEACETLGVRLVTIFSDEWIRKREVCEAYLASILGVFDARIGARSCAVSLVDSRIAKEFLDLHHLQGAGAEARHWGLWSRNELLAVASFRDRGEGVWEMTRYCVKGHWQIIGGFLRLLKEATRTLCATKVVTFADRRWSTGGVYRRAGFVPSATLPPGYWYVKGGSDRHRWHKSAFRKARIEKDLGLEEGETEEAAMRRHGYARIWDCGIVRWELLA